MWALGAFESLAAHSSCETQDPPAQDQLEESITGMAQDPKYAGFFLVALICSASLFPTSASAVTLQSVYDAAGPLEAYTKFLELERDAIYTGGLIIPYTDRVCIKGNGATLDLQTGMIQVQGTGARLDIDHCVIKNGCLPAAKYAEGALSFVGSQGNVINNTFDANTIGIRIYLTGPGAVTVMNNIIVHNTVTGLLCRLGDEPIVSYNDSWSNGTENYLKDCG